MMGSVVGEAASWHVSTARLRRLATMKKARSSLEPCLLSNARTNARASRRLENPWMELSQRVHGCKTDTTPKRHCWAIKMMKSRCLQVGDASPAVNRGDKCPRRTALSFPMWPTSLCHEAQRDSQKTVENLDVTELEAPDPHAPLQVH